MYCWLHHIFPWYAWYKKKLIYDLTRVQNNTTSFYNLGVDLSKCAKGMIQFVAADCGYYISCFNLITLQCSDGLVFDEKTQRCDFAVKVPRCFGYTKEPLPNGK